MARNGDEVNCTEFVELSGVSFTRYFRLSTQTKQGYTVRYGQLLSCFFVPHFQQSICAVCVFDNVMFGILSPMSWTAVRCVSVFYCVSATIQSISRSSLHR